MLSDKGFGEPAPTQIAGPSLGCGFLRAADFGRPRSFRRLFDLRPSFVPMIPPLPSASRFTPLGFTATSWWFGVVWPLASISAAKLFHLPVDRAGRHALFPTTAHLISALLIPITFLIIGARRRPWAADAALGFAAGLSAAWMVLTVTADLSKWIDRLLVPTAVDSRVPLGPVLLIVFGAVAACYAAAAAALTVVREGDERRRRLFRGWLAGAALVPFIDVVIEISTPVSRNGAPTAFGLGSITFYFVCCVVTLIAFAAAAATAAKEPREEKPEAARSD